MSRLVVAALVVAWLAATATTVARAADTEPEACTNPPQTMSGSNGTIILGCEDASCKYAPGMDCLWEVPGVDGDVITLSWVWLDVEASAGCSFDYVELSAVSAAGAQRSLQVACGKVAPEDTTLEAGESLMVHFHSDPYTERPGFELRYALVPVGTPDNGSGNGGSDTGSDAGACGANKPLVLTDATGTIDVGQASGGTAVPAETCEWLLAVPEGDELRLTFAWLHLEDTGAPSACVSSYVEISSPTVPARRACGTDVDLAPAVASGENITISFVTDGVAAGSGFELQYLRYQLSDGPQFEESYPSVASVHDSEVDVDVMVVWAAKVHVMLLEAGAPAPSVSDVLDNTQVTGYLGGGTLQCEDASSVYPVAFQQLDPGTGYDAYFALATYETPPAVSASVTKLSFTTSGAATAPAFTEGYPAVVDVSSDAATLDVSLADDGGVYWVVLTAVEVPPTSDEVLAGHGSGGSQPVSAGAHPTMVHDTVTHLALASIAPSTNYIVYVVATDTNTPPTTQAQPTAVSFTTPDGSCVVSEWSSWTPCSADCGGGTQDRSRSVTTQPSTGFTCPELTQSQACNQQACTNPACVAGADPVPLAVGPAIQHMALGEQAAQLPSSYTSCQWIIPVAAEGGTTTVWFDWVRVDDPDADCTNNYVEIVDGQDDANVLLTQCTHDGVPKLGPHDAVVRATGLDLVVRLHYTTPTNTTGFGISYAALEPDSAPNCMVSPWGEWSQCSKSCGGGEQTRERVVYVEPANGGQLCPALRDRRDCNSQACNEGCQGTAQRLDGPNGTISAGGVGAFTEPATCSWIITGGAGKTVHVWFDEVHFVTCNPDGVTVYVGDTPGGEQVLHTCDTVPGSVEVADSDVLVVFTDFFYSTDPSMTLRYVVETTAAKTDCVLSEWSAWSACSKKCEGGTQTRSRTVDVPAENGGTCSTELSQTQPCNTFPCEADACGESRPQVVTATSGTFGVGAPGGGEYPTMSNCQWQVQATPSQQVRLWFTWLDLEQTAGCQDDYVQVKQVSDGQVLEQQCGSGPADETAFDEVTSTGAALVTFRSDFFGGGAGFAVSYEVTDVGTQPVNCEMSDWSAWSTCSAACGGGTQTRTREVTVPAANGGTACGDTTAQQACNTDVCTNAACGNGQQPPLALSGASGEVSFSVPFGQVYEKNLKCYWLIAHTATQEVRLDAQWIDVAPGSAAGVCGADSVTVYEGSTTSSSVAQHMCGSSCTTCPVVVNSPDESGVLVTFVTGEQGFGAGRGFSLTYSVVSTGDVDCVLGDWGDWGACSVSCGGGTQQRARTILVPAQGSGAACDPATQSQGCNTEACTQESKLAATLTVIMRYNMWQNGVAKFAQDMASDLSNSLAIPLERIAITSVGGAPVRRLRASSPSHRLLDGAASNPLAVVFQLLPPHAEAGGAQVGALVDAFQAALIDPGSALRSGTVTKFLDPAATPEVTYASPPTISLGTTMLVLTSGTLGGTVSVTNTGGSTLVITSIQQDTPVAPWLSVSPSSMTLEASQSKSITIAAATTGLAKGDFFQLVSLEHNDPSGAHAFGVQLRLGDGSGGGEPSVLDSKGFIPGLVSGAVALLLLVLFIAGLVWCVKNKFLPWLQRKLGLKMPERDRFKRLESRRGGDSGGIEPDSPDRGLELKSVEVDRVSSNSLGDGASSVPKYGGNASPLTAAPNGAGGGAGAGNKAGASAAPAVSRPAPGALLKLSASPTVLAPAVFETRWEQLSTLEIWGATLHRVLSDQELETVLGAVNIVCMASGVIDGMQKYYFYAETDGSGVLFMAEVSFASASRRLSAVIKGPTKASEGQGFVKLFKHTLNGLISEQ